MFIYLLLFYKVKMSTGKESSKAYADIESRGDYKDDGKKGSIYKYLKIKY